MKTIAKFIIPIICCLLVGFVASKLQADSLANWYPTLDKSPLNPPNYVFPIVWTSLYVLMGISVGLILNKKNIEHSNLICLFIIQLALNFMWSLIFFNFQNPFLALLELLLLILVVILYIVQSLDKQSFASILFLPYLIWLLFAAYLNAYVLVNN